MEQLKQLTLKHRDRILDSFQWFWQHPETGYREWKTDGYLEHQLELLGYSVIRAGDIPGFYIDADTGRPGPMVAVMAELDGLLCPSHPDSDPETGAVHCCGHGAQLAALIGVAAVLKEPGVLDDLCGKIRLMAVPAEELIETGYRTWLKEEGVIRYFGGKVEFLHRGYFDGVDMAFMIHTNTLPGRSGYIVGGGNGCIVKDIVFEGVAAHAGGSPHQGVNALYAANLAMNAINALRETFQDEDHIRVHPIMTAGGDSVNAIPDRVCMEAYVRGANMDAMVAANQKVNRAIAASAAAIGAQVQLRDIPGYHPIRYSQAMIPLMQKAMEQVLDTVICEPQTIRSGCSDVGDLSGIMPVLHPYISGATGKSHGNDYRITDPETACVASAQVQLCFLKLLLCDGGEGAKQVLAAYEPVYPSRQAYFDRMDKLSIQTPGVQYESDGTVKLTFGA